MKKLLIITLLFLATVTTLKAQFMVYKINNSADAHLFAWKRGNYIIHPTRDGNGDWFIAQGVRNHPMWSDMACRFDSLATLGPLVQLTEYVLRFSNTTDRDAFMEARNQEFFCYTNAKGDVVIDWALEDWSYENENEFNAILANQANLIDIISELLSEGMNPLYYPIPTQETPLNTLCEND